MALTRAGKKREAEKAPGSGVDGMQAEKKLKTSNHVAKTTKMTGKIPALSAAQKKKPPKGLLDMPAEIRNHIYSYAWESDNYEGWSDAVPMVSRHHACCGQKQWPMHPFQPSARKFFGLTQVCKQLRAEYRPMWLRNSSIRITHRNLRWYIHTFYGCSPKYENMPKLIQVSWVHNDDGEVIDLAQSLRIRAHSSRTKVEFIPHVLTEEDGPWNDPVDPMDCFHCEMEMEMHMEVDSLDSFMMDEWECTHAAERFESYMEFILEDEYPYLASLNELIAHDNPAWLADIRSHKINRIKMDLEDREMPDVSIRLDPEGSLVNKKRRNVSLKDVVNKYCETRGLKRIYGLFFDLLISQDYF